jgi:hypothetical protein
MAVTNRSKDAEKSPKWAQRGTLRLAHVEGGPAVAARAIHLKTWDGSPSGLLPACRYAPELADELAARNISAVCLTWSIGFSHEGDAGQWALATALLAHLKKKKIRAIAEISLSTAYDELFARHPAANEWLQRDASGEPVQPAGDGMQGARLMSLEQPGWLAYLTEKIKAALLAGVDGLYLTNANEDAAAARFVRQARSFVATIRPEDAPEFAIYTNNVWSGEFLRVCNLKWDPVSAAPGLSAEGDGGALKSNLGYWKYFFELAGRDKAFAGGGGPALNARERALTCAEVLSAGGAPAGLDAPAAMLAFHAEHAALFSGDPQGEVGLLLPDSAAVHGQASPGAAFAAMLLRAGVQFDVLPLSQLDSFDLKRYGLLCAFHLAHVPAEALAKLEGFVERHGGTLLTSPGTATRDAKGESAEQPALLSTPEDSFATVEKTVGKGKVIVLQPPPLGFSGATQADLLRDVLPVLKAAGPADTLTVSGGDGVVPLLWGKGTRRWVHVLNYGAAPANAAITLPGCGGRTVEVFSPDTAPPALEILETGAGAVRFTLSGLETYAVVAVQ